MIITSGGTTVLNDTGPPNGSNLETIYFDVSGGGGSCGDVCDVIGGSANCCTNALQANAGFEDVFTSDEKFPNASLAIIDNATTGDFSQWTYADGGYNSSPQSVIFDSTRASEGDQFLHIPLPTNPSVFNYCVANSLGYSAAVTQCEDDTWFDNLRYVFRMDYVPFNRDHPEGGVGGAYPACEHNIGGFKELEMYDKDGNHLANETSVAWNDVANSWRKAYAVSDKLSSVNSTFVIWVSLNKASTTGILIDDTYLSPLRIADAGVTEVTCGNNNNEITVALSPVSNVLNVPDIDYVVCPPSGYSISPEKGAYGEITYFTLTKDSGNFSTGSLASISLTVADEVNTDCVVYAEIENPFPNCSQPIGAIGNVVWLDEDSDGVQSDGERGLPNVKVYLLDKDEVVIDETITDGNGGYIFPNLSTDIYFVKIDQTSLPTNVIANFDEDNGTSNPDHQTRITLGPEEYLTADFGYNWVSKSDCDNPTTMTETGTIGDRVWHDVNSNGKQDMGEPGIAGVQLSLLTDPDFDGNYTANGMTTVTDKFGNYIFDNIAPASYIIQVEESDISNAGFDISPTKDPDRDGNNITRPIALAPGDVWLRGDFGYVATSAFYDIGSIVYIDENGNGTFDFINEKGIGSVTVALFFDTNDNGIWDDGDKTVATTITGDDGSYLFKGISDEDYLVVITDTENILERMENLGDPDNASQNESAVQMNGADELNENFGYAPTDHSNGKGFIGDLVFLDADGEGDFDLGERGMEGVTVQLLDDATGDVLSVSTTNENGNYFFGNLADGSYRVKVDNSTVATGLESSYDPDGSAPVDNEGSTITITSGSSDMNQDFGYKASTARTLSGNVWGDSNANGAIDINEDDIFEGIQVVLYNSSGQIMASAFTDSQGDYQFIGLPPMEYILSVVDVRDSLDGYWQSIGTDAEADVLNIDLTNGNVTDVDFGYFNKGAALGNLVWLDYNGDGMQDDDEPGLEGAKLTLEIDYDNDGTPEITTVVVSGLKGDYCFENLLLDEDYQGDNVGVEPVFEVRVERPNDAFAATINVNTGNDNLDSDSHTGIAVTPQKGKINVDLDNNTEEHTSIDFAFDFDCTRPSVEYAVTTNGTDNNATQTTNNFLEEVNGKLLHNSKNQQHGIIRSNTYCLHGDWRYYFNPLDPDEYLFAIRMNSNTTEIEYIELRIDDSTEDRLVVGANTASYVMMRDWFVQTVDDDALTSPVDIRFYFPPDEFERMYDQAIAQATNEWGVGMPQVGNIKWFKKDIFDPENDIEETGNTLLAYDITNLQVGATDSSGTNTNDSYMDGAQAIGNDKNHIQFNGITGFSGGTAFLPISQSALPVDLSRFEGRSQDCSIEINWTAESELKFNYYELEWSENGIDFTKLDRIYGSNNNTQNSYQYIHERPVDDNYYRLKMMDFDGSFEYSKTIQTKAKCKGDSKLYIYPNPTTVREGILNIEYTSSKSSLQIEIIDALGKQIRAIEIQPAFDTKYSHQLKIDDLAQGVYMLRIKGEGVVKQFVVSY